MKKSIIWLAVASLALTLGLSAAAAPVSPNGMQVTTIYDYMALQNGDTTGSAVGIWYPGGDYPVTVDNGKITMQDAVWGAFPSLTADQMAMLQNKQGTGFYFEASDQEDAVIGYGFNDNAGVNYVLGEGMSVLLATTAGKVTKVTSEMNSSYNQGGVTVPAGFKGYVFFPFNAFVKNGAPSESFPNDGSTFMNTPIFVIMGAVPVVYGELVAYSGSYTAPDNGGNTGDISLIGYTLTALTGLGGLAVLIKKKRL